MEHEGNVEEEVTSNKDIRRRLTWRRSWERRKSSKKRIS